MKLICSNRFKTNCTRFAKSCIVAVFSLFSCSAIAQEDANTAAIASDVETILQSLNWALRNPVTSSPGYIPDRLDDLLEYDTATYKFLTGRTSTTASINYNDKNALPYLIGSLVYGLTGWAPNSSKPLDYSLHGDLTTGNQTLLQLLDLLNNISNVVAQSSTTVVVSNTVSVTNSGVGGVVSPDILAGNPWWATNSAFAMNRAMYGTAFPKTETAKMYSFPQFMSRWAALLTLSPNPVYPTASQLSKWYNFYGHGRSPAIGEAYPYTWFDYMGDWMTSNAVASNTRHSDITKLLRNISNEVSDSSAYIVNHLDSSLGDSNFYLSNIVHVLSGISPDILAGNPWWATNSGFRIGFDNFFDPPYPTSPNGALSFPEIFSIMAGTHNRFQTAPVYDSQEWLFDSWGYDRWNMQRGQLYTFEDWLADAFRSNFVLVSTYGITTGTNDLVAVSQSTGAETIIDDGETTNTNVLDELTLEKADTDAISGLIDFIDAERVGGMFDSMDVTPDPQLRLFSGGRYGDVTVDAVYADFTLPDNVASIISLAARWLWHILVMVSLFGIVRQEFDYWSTLGGSAGA